MKGSRRFLEKAYGLQDKIKGNQKNPGLVKLIHQTIKKVSEDIEGMKFNTAISALMVLVNAMEKQAELSNNDYQALIILLSPFAPHLAEELWQEMGNKKSVLLEKWPEYDRTLIKEEKINLIIQINGQVRDKVQVEAGLSEEQAKAQALELEKIKKWLENKQIKKVIFVQNKLINFVI